ncbi:MAG: hypothetical protein APR53_06785 [Methanoculleus sp. SDB]|nr:MAG: hypothetical protein APR53_06785 [Methanoculleus sp. SDB]
MIAEALVVESRSISTISLLPDMPGEVPADGEEIPEKRRTPVFLWFCHYQQIPGGCLPRL